MANGITNYLECEMHIIKEVIKRVLLDDDSTYEAIDIATLLSVKIKLVDSNYKILEYLQDLSDTALLFKKTLEEEL